MAAVTVWPGARQGCSESPQPSQLHRHAEPCLLFGESGLVLKGNSCTTGKGTAVKLI